MSAAATGWRIVRDDLTHPQVVALVEQHLRAAFENSPADGVFALDLNGLRDPAVMLWTAWEDDTLLGMGAIKALGPREGELKSMRTASGQERRGVAAALLDHLIAEARGRGWAVLRLETGGNDAFAPARALYERVGFRAAEAFGDYVLTDFNRCYALAL